MTSRQRDMELLALIQKLTDLIRKLSDRVIALEKKLA